MDILHIIQSLGDPLLTSQIVVQMWNKTWRYVPAFSGYPDPLETKFILTAQINNILAWNMDQTKKYADI